MSDSLDVDVSVSSSWWVRPALLVLLLLRMTRVLGEPRLRRWTLAVIGRGCRFEIRGEKAVLVESFPLRRPAPGGDGGLRP